MLMEELQLVWNGNAVFDERVIDIARTVTSATKREAAFDIGKRNRAHSRGSRSYGTDVRAPGIPPELR
jgi:hypothetical protein